MKMLPRKGHVVSLLFGACLSAAFAQESAPPIPAEKITELKAVLTGSKEESSAARKRLAVKRAVRDAGELLKAHPSATNRFEVLGVLFKLQQEIVAADNSTENREAFLETSRQLAAAPDEYAGLRFDAELLVTQSEMVRKGADARERAAALMPLVLRYRGTPVETKVVKVAIVMALELGDTRLVNELQQSISERYAGDLEMIQFQRDKLGGQVIGAPFCGAFETSDGKRMRFPMDGMGKTTALFFWSNDETSLKHLKAIAASDAEHKTDTFGRIQIISFNVDNLPDAGESILRGMGVDWPAVRLPEGRENPFYKTFAAKTPAMIPLSASGQAALLMAGSTKNSNPKKGDPYSDPDYSRLFTVEINREWANQTYANRLISLFSGEFLVLDPEGPLDPTMPPELKSVAGAARLSRDAACVPEEKLLAIQECFVAPPVRYRTSKIEQKAIFEKAEALCAKVIGEHAQAPDLWLVRNRRITALLGLWKLTSQFSYYESAAAEARLVLESKPPVGADLVARLCLVRETLRSKDAIPKAVIADFLATLGGDKASGPAMAAAALLALEVGDRSLHEELRKTILARHAEEPMMWAPVAFMLCRHSRYWIYQVPFTAGWSYARREGYFLAVGDPEDCKRTFSAEFKTLDGKSLVLPKENEGKWTVVHFFDKQEDVSDKTAKSLANSLRYAKTYVENRPSKDVGFYAAFLDDDAQRVGAYAYVELLGCPVLLVPGGSKNPLAQKLGIMGEDQTSNVLLVRPDGSIAAALSGLAVQGKHSGSIVENIIDWQDEKLVSDALERGDIEEAKRLAFLHAPTEPPVSTDPKKKNIKVPPPSLSHLSSRARVYLALKEYSKALADAEEVVNRQIGTDGGMSLRSKELDDAELFRDQLRKLSGQPEK